MTTDLRYSLDDYDRTVRTAVAERLSAVDRWAARCG